MRPLTTGHAIAPGTRILEHLHRSNGLDVYDAYDEQRACRVIVKTLRPDKLRQAGARARLLREGELLSRLAHPHLVRGYAVHEQPRPAIVLETLTGETVEHLASPGRKPLSAGELANLGSHLASALHYLHGQGVLHLDLKPSNVVAEAGRAKVIDLSHAKPPGEMGPGNGTWCYMAPEQVGGGAIGPAADVWGLGIVLYAAAVQGNPLADLAEKLDVDDPQLHARLDPLHRRRRLPRTLTALVDACLEPAAGDRPAVAEVLETLDRLA